MKTIRYIAATITAALLAQNILLAQTSAPAPAAKPGASMSEKDPVAAELNALVEKVRGKIKAGQTTEASFAEEIKGFDTLIANNPKAQPDTLAQIELLKAMLYLQVFEDTGKGAALLQKIKTDYPTSKIAGKVDGMLAQIAKQGEAKKVQSALAPGAAFPDFNVKDLDGKSLSVAALKGKVVLIDFWATWCGPCQMMAPFFEQAARQLEPRFRFAKLDTDAESAPAQRYGIRSIPTLIVFRGGREFARQSGAMDAGQLTRWLEAATA